MPFFQDCPGPEILNYKIPGLSRVCTNPDNRNALKCIGNARGQNGSINLELSHCGVGCRRSIWRCASKRLHIKLVNSGLWSLLPRWPHILKQALHRNRNFLLLTDNNICVQVSGAADRPARCSASWPACCTQMSTVSVTNWWPRDRHQFTTWTVNLSWQHLRWSVVPEIWLVSTKI